METKKIIFFLFFLTLLNFISLKPLYSVNDEVGKNYPLSGILKKIFIRKQVVLKSDSIVIPLKRAGRLFFIEAIIDGESGNLVFDTGATGLVLNRSYFRNHVVLGNQKTNGITGSVDEVEIVTAESVKISGLSFRNVSANLAALGHIENKRGLKVLGLCGFNVFKGFEIIIDFRNNELRLNPVDKKGARMDNLVRAFKTDFVQKVEISDNILFVKGTIGNKILRFCFDTGAETNAISSFSSKSVLENIRITRTIKLKGAGSGSNEVVYGVLNDFSMSDNQLTGMQTLITNLDHLNQVYGFHIDGVLGYDFLMRGTFCINLMTKEMKMSLHKEDKS